MTTDDRKDNAQEYSKEDIDSPSRERVVSVDERVTSIKNDARPVDRREALSAYFTIAAAAFGLISDGCKSASIISMNLRIEIDFRLSIQTRTI